MRKPITQAVHDIASLYDGPPRGGYEKLQDVLQDFLDATLTAAQEEIARLKAENDLVKLANGSFFKLAGIACKLMTERDQLKAKLEQADHELASRQYVLDAANAATSRAGKQIAELKEALEAEKKETKGQQEWINDLCADLCKMEDALGFRHDQHRKDGSWRPTIEAWLERVRDLIASEGELGDVKVERDQLKAIEPAVQKLTLDYGWTDLHDKPVVEIVEFLLEELEDQLCK